MQGSTAYALSIEFALSWYPSADYQMIIEVEMGHAGASLRKPKVICKVTGEVASEAEVMFSVVDG